MEHYYWVNIHPLGVIAKNEAEAEEKVRELMKEGFIFEIDDFEEDDGMLA